MTDQTTHHAEAILRAAGSSLRHYEPRTREAILAAVREAVEAERRVVVDWIRDKAISAWGADCTGIDETGFIACAIEAGEHLPTPPRGE